MYINILAAVSRIYIPKTKNNLQIHQTILYTEKKKKINLSLHNFVLLPIFTHTTLPLKITQKALSTIIPLSQNHKQTHSTPLQLQNLPPPRDQQGSPLTSKKKKLEPRTQLHSIFFPPPLAGAKSVTRGGCSTHRGSPRRAAPLANPPSRALRCCFCPGARGERALAVKWPSRTHSTYRNALARAHACPRGLIPVFRQLIHIDIQ